MDDAALRPDPVGPRRFTASSGRGALLVQLPRWIGLSSPRLPSKVAGLVIVGFGGHFTTTALGRSLPGSTSSIFSVWPLRLPWANGVTFGDWVTPRFSRGLPRPWSVLATPVGAAYLFELVILVSPPICKPFANGRVSTGLDRMGWRGVQVGVKRLVEGGLAGHAATDRYGPCVCSSPPSDTKFA
jgi:hypothetical protein